MGGEREGSSGRKHSFQDILEFYKKEYGDLKYASAQGKNAIEKERVKTSERE